MYPQGLYSSNLSTTSSNFLYPQGLYSSNTSYYSSNVSTSSSNFLFSNFSWFVSNNKSYSLYSNIGIGISNPQYSLDVSGKIFASNQYLSYYSTSNIPTYSWFNSSNTGIYCPSSNVIGFSLNGSEEMTIELSNVNIPNNKLILSQILGKPDTSNIPTYSWSNDSNTGLYNPSTDTIGITLGGVEKIKFTPSNTLFSSNITVTSNLIVRNVNYNFGRETFFAQDSNATTQNTATFTDKLRLNTFVEGGTYNLSVYTQGSYAVNTRTGVSRVILSNLNGATQVLQLSSNNYPTANLDVVIPYSAILTLPTGSNSIAQQYSTLTSAMTLKNTTITLIRTS